MSRPLSRPFRFPGRGITNTLSHPRSPSLHLGGVLAGCVMLQFFCIAPSVHSLLFEPLAGIFHAAA